MPCGMGRVCRRPLTVPVKGSGVGAMGGIDTGPTGAPSGEGVAALSPPPPPRCWSLSVPALPAWPQGGGGRVTVQGSVRRGGEATFGQGKLSWGNVGLHFAAEIAPPKVFAPSGPVPVPWVTFPFWMEVLVPMCQEGQGSRGQ